MKAFAIKESQNLLLLKLIIEHQYILLNHYDDCVGTEYAQEIIPHIRATDELIDIFMPDPTYNPEEFRWIQAIRKRMMKIGLLEESQVIINMRDPEEEQDLKEVLLKSYGATEI